MKLSAAHQSAVDCLRHEQREKQHDEEVFESAKLFVIVGRADDEQPSVKERVRAHVVLSSNSQGPRQRQGSGRLPPLLSSPVGER